jgi:hypothetical protein
MRLSRRQLRKLISETILREQEEGEKYLGFDEVSDNSKALKFKVARGGPVYNAIEELKKQLPAAGISLEKGYYLAKSYYEDYKSTYPNHKFGATGPSLGISGKGDPYTYKPLKNGLVLVVSGPDPKAVGKTFKPKKKIKGGDENLSMKEMKFQPFVTYGSWSDLRNQLIKKGIDPKKFGAQTDFSSYAPILGIDLNQTIQNFQQFGKQSGNVFDRVDEIYAEIASQGVEVLGMSVADNLIVVAVYDEDNNVIPALSISGGMLGMDGDAFKIDKGQNKTAISLSGGDISLPDSIFVQQVSESFSRGTLYRNRYRRY